MADSQRSAAEPGAALYSKPFLSLYDLGVLGFTLRFIWACPSHHLLDLYNSHASANHLDIGVGTGYFMDRCKFPGGRPRLALMDLNPNSLKVASKRLARYHPEVYQASALEPFSVGARLFESVGMVNLLHCLPGNMKTKAAVFENAKAVMSPGGVLFGSTIPGLGARHGRLATVVLRANNRKGIMTNLADDVFDLREGLRRNFTDSSVRLIGSMALFWAHK